MMPRVYVPQEPTRRDKWSGELEALYDLRPAVKFGEILIVLPREVSLEPSRSLPLLKNGFEGFLPDDYLLPIGPPQLIAWAAIYAARKTKGFLNLLSWRSGEKCYIPITANLSE